MSRNVRVGVVGTSEYAREMHLTNLRSHPAVELVAICGRRQEHAEAIAETFQIPQVFTDYQEMIASARLDALVVAAPDDLHYPITLAALDAKLHVLCETPLAVRAEQAYEMYIRAEAAGICHMVPFTAQWRPVFRHLGQLIETGYYGQLYQIVLTYLAGYARNREYRWRFDGQRANGVLGDLGPHAIQMARQYAGEIVSVSAQLATFVPPTVVTPTNDTVILSVQFANGAQGVFQLSAAAHVGDRGAEQHVRLYGAEGSLEAETTVQHETVRGVRAPGVQWETLPIPDALWGEADRTDSLDIFRKQSIGARHWIDCILAGQPASPSFYDGYRVQLVIEAALESQRTGQRILVAGF
jgi:predicted dehydrogenase